MGSLRLAAIPIYIDSNVFIYAIEGERDIAEPIEDLFARIRGRKIAVTSELTLAEVLPKARPHHRRAYLNLLLWSELAQLEPVSRPILLETANYRRQAIGAGQGNREVMPKLPDAIHVVTAIRSRCRTFLSGDNRVRLPDALTVMKPDAAEIARLVEKLS